MSLDHDGFAFGSPLHDPIQTGESDVPIQRQQNAGVLGEAHLIGEAQGRDLTCEATLYGYATKPLLQAALDAIANQSGRLTGTLTETVLGSATTYAQTTFVGASLIDGPRRDGSGVNGWIARVRLAWRQRASS